MGRIDDALRRLGTTDDSPAPGERASASEAPDNEVFSSPWSVHELQDLPQTHEAAEAAAPPVEPVDVHLVPSRSFEEPGPVLRREPSTDRSELLTGVATADPALSAQFRRMAATLYNAQDQGDLKLVMVTSAVPGEGKTLTATNMALILSGSFRRRVLLIDADLRRPSLHRTWGIDTNRGLSDALNPTSPQRAQVFQVSETLSLLPAGRPDEDPIGGLTSSRMRQLLEDARTRFDWVILDSPPITAVDDATLLGSMVDAVLFVVRAQKTRAAMVRQAIESVGRDRIFGVVLNGAEASDSPRYGYYSDGYSARPE